MFSEDVKEMIINGQIGSFLHRKEANYLQELAYKSKLKIHYLLELMQYMETLYIRELPFIPLQ